MFVTLISLILLAGIGFAAYRAWEMRQAAAREPQDTRHPLMRCEPGAVLQLPPTGDDMQERDVEVRAKHRYVEDGYEWHELVCDAGDSQLFLDVEYDDELEATVTLSSLALTDLGLGIDEIDSTQRVEYQGQAYYQDEAGKARYYADGRGQGESFEYWDFVGRDGYAIAVERWGTGDCRAYLTQSINPDRVQIYREGAEV